MSQPVQAAGRYTILGKIAEGGMAEIFLARQKSVAGFTRTVVIKRILPHLARNRDFVGMFVDEAKIAALLHHPNVVQIHDLGRDRGTYYIVMEYVKGRDLRFINRNFAARGARVPIDVACRIVAEVCHGLDYAHRMTDHWGAPLGLIHRDVSPQNVLIGVEGEVKLIDFGIAKARGKIAETRTGRIKGKYAYMSPEQVMGKEIDSRSDLFSVGIVFWETLVGKSLFSRDEPLATARAVAELPIEPPGTLVEGVPAEVDRIVMKALDRDKETRYQTAAQIADDIEAFVTAQNRHVSPGALRRFLEESGSMDREGADSLRHPNIPDSPSLEEIELESLAVAAAPAESPAPPAPAPPTKKQTASAASKTPRPASRTQPKAAPRGRGRWVLPSAVVVMVCALAAIFVFLLPKQRGDLLGTTDATPPATGPAAKVAPGEGMGVLAVDTRPRVETTLDGKPIRTPYRKRTEPGRYTLRMTDPEWGIDETRTVRVEAGKTNAVEIEFNGRLIVSTVPAMDVWLDDERVAEDSFLDTRSVPAGTHKLRLEGAGGDSEQSTITVRYGQTVTHRRVFYREAILAADRRWATSINGLAGTAPIDEVMRVFSGTRVLYVLLLVFALVLFWQGGTSGRAIVLVALGAGVVAEMLTGFVFQPLWERVRPCAELAESIVAVAGVSCPGTPSFPAPMAAGAMAVGVVFFAWGLRWSFIPVLVIALAGIAPIYCALHYPVDVAVGYLVGGVVGLIGLLAVRAFYRDAAASRVQRSFSPYRSRR